MAFSGTFSIPMTVTIGGELYPDPASVMTTLLTLPSPTTAYPLAGVVFHSSSF